MNEVRFLVTGECERGGLAESFQRCFGSTGASFSVARCPAQSFTSSPLTEPPSSRARDTIDKFAISLLEEVHEHPDALVVGVDDLELQNDPLETVAAIRAAISRGMEIRWSSLNARNRVADRMREYCSFHLLVPMVEAYFFGEPEALERAGAVRRSLFDCVSSDPEQFQVEDAEYLAAPETTPESEPNPERRKRSWAKKVALRRLHPKLYLKFLCSPDDPFGAHYRETRGGVEALRMLAWARVISNGDHVQFARALFADIADFLGTPAPFPGAEPEATSRFAQRRDRVLRNI
ncbi:MAG: hypothetical protein ACYC8T_07490 [Myxococcaceae bacterium]